MEYPSNSDKNRTAMETPEDRAKKVVIKKGHARVRQNKTRGVINAIVPEDMNFSDYLIYDLLIPAGKKVISEFIDTLLFGESRHDRRDRRDRPYRSYDQYSDRRDGRSESPRRSGYNYDDVEIASRGEAEDVLDKMLSQLEEYGFCSVGDMYDFAGVSGSYTDNKYGWTDLRSADIVRTRGGFMLKLPRALPLK